MDLIANFFEIIDELNISQSFETPMKEARVVGYNLCHQSVFQDWADSIRMTKDELTKVILDKQEISVSTFGNSQTKVKILFYGQSIQCEDLFATLQEKWQLLKTQFEAASSNLVDTWDLDTCKVKFESLSASVLNIQSRLDTIDSRLAVIEEKLQSHCDHSDASASISNINSTNLQRSSSSEHQDHSEFYKFTSKTSVNSDLEQIMKAKRDDLSWIKMIRNKRIENISLTKMRKVRSILITGPTLPGKVVRRIARRLFGRDRLQTTKMIDFAAGYKVPTDRDRKRSFSMKETKSFIEATIVIITEDGLGSMLKRAKYYQYDLAGFKRIIRDQRLVQMQDDLTGKRENFRVLFYGHDHVARYFQSGYLMNLVNQLSVDKNSFKIIESRNLAFNHKKTQTEISHDLESDHDKIKKMEKEMENLRKQIAELKLITSKSEKANDYIEDLSNKQNWITYMNKILAKKRADSNWCNSAHDLILSMDEDMDSDLSEVLVSGPTMITWTIRSLAKTIFGETALKLMRIPKIGDHGEQYLPQNAMDTFMKALNQIDPILTENGIVWDHVRETVNQLGRDLKNKEKKNSIFSAARSLFRPKKSQKRIKKDHKHQRLNRDLNHSKESVAAALAELSARRASKLQNSKRTRIYPRPLQNTLVSIIPSPSTRSSFEKHLICFSVSLIFHLVSSIVIL